MGFADRDHAQVPPDNERVFSTPEPSAFNTLWVLLFWGLMALASYRVIAWWQQDTQPPHTPPTATPTQPAPQLSAARSAEPPERQRPAQASRPAMPTAPTAEPPDNAPTGQVSKCVVNGVTSYTDQPCPSHARAVAVHVSPAVNVFDRVPTPQAAPPQPEAVAQGTPPPAAPSEPPELWKKRVCAYHDEAIRWIDARAREPLSAWEQDDLAARRRKHRDEQYRLRCQ
ncbi:MAG: hypothetical protein KF740_15430 [Ramlibacter sp.]|nr:hypothetical protein [Ramlibacter sp.]